MRLRLLTTALQVFLDFEDILSFVLIALGGTRGRVATAFIVVVTVFPDLFAIVFRFGQLGLGVGVHKVHHVDDVFAAARARRTGTRWAKSEAHQILSINDALSTVPVLLVITFFLSVTLRVHLH